MTAARYLIGDVFDRMAELPDNSVDLVLTSPPFLALRSYLPADHPDKGKEIGSEPTPGAFIDTLLALTEEWARLLSPSGSLCVELGDTYAGSGGAGGDYNDNGLRANQPKFRQVKGDGWPLEKSMCLIPELYRVALVYGFNPLTGRETSRWRARNVVRWCRPNPPVGALGDKFRPATSDMVVACKAKDRWFDLDAVRTAYSENSHPRTAGGVDRQQRTAKTAPDGNRATLDDVNNNGAGAPPLDWWKISTEPYAGSHYATWPTELCRVPVDAMCPRRVCTGCGEPSRREVEHGDLEATSDARIAAWDRGKNHDNDADRGGMAAGLKAGGFIPNHVRPATTTGWTTCGCPGADGIRLDGFHTGPAWRPGVVLDPFAGSGTTLLVATGHGRDAIGIDLDERNADLARERVGMFLEVDDQLPRPVVDVDLPDEVVA